MRNCTDCRFVVACQQFRTRDCSDIDVAIYCQTLPIIEATSAVRFSCFFGSFFGLEGQFNGAELGVYNNNWSRIHDFTPGAGGGTNYEIVAKRPAWADDFFAHAPEDVASLCIKIDPAVATVPVTLGSRKAAATNPNAPSTLVVVLEPNALKTAKKFLRALLERNEGDFELVNTKQTSMTRAQAQSILRGAEPEALNAAENGAMVGLELYGEAAANKAEAILLTLSGAVWYTSPVAEALDVIQAFYSHTDQDMAV